MIELFVDIKGYEGLYQISNFGVVKALPKPIKLPDGEMSLRKEKLLKPGRVKGYLRVSLTKGSVVKQFSIHRLVAEAFIPNPYNKNEVNHVKGNKTDNRYYMLEWVTRDENMIHSYIQGTHLPHKGESNGRSKLLDKTVINIKTEYKKGNISTTSLGEKYGVHNTTINRIVNSKMWVHVK